MMCLSVICAILLRSPLWAELSVFPMQRIKYEVTEKADAAGVREEGGKVMFAK